MTRSVRNTLAVVLCWLVVGVGPGSGQEPAKNGARKVTAHATATALVKPDGARLTFAVTTSEVPSRSLREAHEKRVKKVKDALSGLGLKKVEMDIQVLPSSVSTLVSGQANADGSRTVQGKRARSIFSVAVRDKNADNLREAVVKLAEAVADNGGTGLEEDDPLRRIRLPRRFGGGDEPETVPGPTIEWQAAGGGTARRDAIRRAVSDALADAQAAVGQAKLQVLEIDVSASKDLPVVYRPRGISVDNTGLIPIRVEVRVTCGY